MAEHGRFFWNELMTRDVEAAKTFYADSLGWTFTSQDMGPAGIYWLAMDGEEAIAGLMNMAGPDFEGMPEHWMSYIAVDDIDARIEKAKAAGATILNGPFDVPTVGRMAVVQQPDKAVVSWMTPSD